MASTIRTKAERATVSGHLVLKDPQAKNAKMCNILVGLTAPAYTIQIPARTFNLASRGPAAALQPQLAAYRQASAAARLRQRRLGSPASERPIDWQTDAKHYEFWARADANGNFKLTNVRPGTYTLHAMADGVLGEYAKTDVTVEAGKPLDLGIAGLDAGTLRAPGLGDRHSQPHRRGVCRRQGLLRTTAPS